MVLKKDLKASLLKDLGDNSSKAYYIDLVNDYLNLWDISKKLVTDVRKNGVTVEWKNSETSFGTKDNPSIQNLLKTKEQMGKTLELIEKGFINPPTKKSEVEIKRVKKFGSEVNA